MTNVEAIELSHHADDLEQTIKSVCNIQEAQNFSLSSSFVYETRLILIFQKKS